jgi:hypothetical protein
MRTMYRTHYENGECNEFTIKDTQVEKYYRIHQVDSVVDEQGDLHRDEVTVIDNGDCLRVTSSDGIDDIVIDYGTAEILMTIFYHNFTTVEGVKLDKVEKE